MASGPVLIFDKSTLQSLSVDESFWLDNFFLTNITPIFFVETLADLEKEVRSGRTPEQAVGSLAFRTPDMGSKPNAHHMTLLAAELQGRQSINLDSWRPIIPGGHQMQLEGKAGILFQQSPEEEALMRWQRGEFLELERMTAKKWRMSLSSLDLKSTMQKFNELFGILGKPNSLETLKLFVDKVVDDQDTESVLCLGLGMIGVSAEASERVIVRWRETGSEPLNKFAPYFRYVLVVDLFFYAGIAAGFISGDRPSNKVDMAYLYYLPFCHIFTSNDNLHARVAPLFLRADQSFVIGNELKADLRSLDQYYSQLTEEVKQTGATSFAIYPPDGQNSLVTRLWDKHLPNWRTRKEPIKLQDLNPAVREELARGIRRFIDESKPSLPGTFISVDQADQVVLSRKVFLGKGKWRRFSREFEELERNSTESTSDGSE